MQEGSPLPPPEEFDSQSNDELEKPEANSWQQTQENQSEDNSETEAKDFVWWRDLSEGGQNLYKLLVAEVGFRDELGSYATEHGFDLDVAMDELRRWGFLDESDPEMIRLK